MVSEICDYSNCEAKYLFKYIYNIGKIFSSDLNSFIYYYF